MSNNAYNPLAWALGLQLLVGGLLVTIVLGALAVGGVQVVALLAAIWDAIPPETWTLLHYLALGIWGGLPFAYYIVKKLWTPTGIEVLELDPVADDHRHLRVGRETWSDVIVKTPWGEPVTTGALNDITLNGRHGYEVMDLRVPDEGPPTCVSTWLGDATSSQLRTYQYAIEYARKRMAKQADRALLLDANRSAIAREAAERVVRHMIRTADRSAMPHGAEITNVVDDVLDEFGLNDRLDDDGVADADRDDDADRDGGGLDDVLDGDGDLDVDALRNGDLAPENARRSQ